MYNINVDLCRFATTIYVDRLGRLSCCRERSLSNWKLFDILNCCFPLRSCNLQLAAHLKLESNQHNNVTTDHECSLIRFSTIHSCYKSERKKQTSVEKFHST